MNQAKSLGKTVSRIGIGVAELVDHHGNVVSSQTIKWQGLDVQTNLSSYAPTVLESDVCAAALAEGLFGAGKGLGSFLYVTVGTGISHCFVQSGRLLKGARGNALVFASSPYTVYDQDKPKEYPPLETFSSGPALVQRYNQMTSKSLTEGTEVVAAAKQGGEAAHFVLESAGAALGVDVGWSIPLIPMQSLLVVAWVCRADCIGKPLKKPPGNIFGRRRVGLFLFKEPCLVQRQG